MGPFKVKRITVCASANKTVKLNVDINWYIKATTGSKLYLFTNTTLSVHVFLVCMTSTRFFTALCENPLPKPKQLAEAESCCLRPH